MKKLTVKHNLVMGAVLLIDETKNTIAKIALPESKSGNSKWRTDKAQEIGQELANAFNDRLTKQQVIDFILSDDYFETSYPSPTDYSENEVSTRVIGEAYDKFTAALKQEPNGTK
ncbi:hypothetical protein M1M30_gp141 [Maribacter phage Colly_1]|uniref:Uncharacterized protein n=1 Tax=Maribacter phage Colly_1 TaxID=2745691 RepID=A0A8E4XXY4_9CAUD|nr:hypothetical protein M1M30_gp141 [Maribacter phage Colly_1]QQO97242.1 hypothetical protein Colly1_141 [Maribacter phage Colly_1]